MSRVNYGPVLRSKIRLQCPVVIREDTVCGAMTYKWT